jgi:predicted transcriptional regulator of viral defense system
VNRGARRLLPGGLLPNRRIDAAISHSASRYGHIHFRQLRALGLSQRAIADRYKTGRLIRVFHEVYAVGHAQRTAIARADAAVMACGVRAALSHDSAAALYGLGKWPRVPEISSAIQHRRPGIRSHRIRTLTLDDVTYRQGIRVTTVARTIADIAPRLDDVQLTRAIHEARRNRDLTDHGLARLYALCPRAAYVFDSEEAPSRSIFQHTFTAFLELRGFPIPVFEADWHGYQVDAYYADHTLIIELDGYRDHSLPDRFEADRERDELAIALQHATLRITWKRLTRKPGELDRNLRAILAARAPQ